MKTFFLSFLLLLFAMPCAAQSTCGLGLKDAPEFFGLRLGMSPLQVRSVFGKALKVKIKKEGTFFQNFIEKPPPQFLSGVRALYLRFFDRRLYQIEIFYEDKGSRQTLAGFTGVLTANLKLPEVLWEETAAGRRQLKCAEFTLVADNVLNPRVELTDEITRAQVEELRLQESEKKKGSKK